MGTSDKIEEGVGKIPVFIIYRGINTYCTVYYSLTVVSSLTVIKTLHFMIKTFTSSKP